MSVPHLEVPDRLRATAAAQLGGTGKRWRSLPTALALHWAVALGVPPGGADLVRPPVAIRWRLERPIPGGVDAGDGVGGLSGETRQERAPGHLHGCCHFLLHLN
jgi:hypothetical protein